MRIYVGNLPYSLREDELGNFFEAFGKVESVSIVYDRDTGRSKGFAFVEMPDDAEGHEACSQINGKEIEGRALTVNEARPREERSGGGGGYGGGGGGRRGGGGGYGGGGGGNRRGGGGGGGRGRDW